MRVLFDTNVLLDVLLRREPEAEVAARLLSLADVGRIEGIIAATTVTTIFYLATKSLGSKAAKSALREVLAVFDVATVDRDVLSNAMDLEFGDFEDAVLHEAARKADATAIVTRDGRGFANASLPVFSPRELLAAIVTTSE